MSFREVDPGSYITEYRSVYEEYARGILNYACFQVINVVERDMVRLKKQYEQVQTLNQNP
jgi:hypothetical protein